MGEACVFAGEVPASRQDPSVTHKDGGIKHTRTRSLARSQIAHMTDNDRAHVCAHAAAIYRGKASEGFPV